MTLEILPLEEADISIYDDITTEAFDGEILALLYPNGQSKADKEFAIARNLKKWRKHPDTIKKMKVVDTELPDNDPFRKILGVADWNIYPRERSEAELKQEEEEGKKDDHAPGLNVAFSEHFFSELTKNKNKIFGGKPYVYLHILASRPIHHRRGAGAMHLNWGLEEAKKLGLPVYLESSPMGRPLYARMGFETVGWLDFDAKEWGLDHDLPHALMLRPGEK